MKSFGCGESGAMIIFNGVVWHGHTAKDYRRCAPIRPGLLRSTGCPSGFDFRNRLVSEARTRMSPLGQYLLSLDSSESRVVIAMLPSHQELSYRSRTG